MIVIVEKFFSTAWAAAGITMRMTGCVLDGDLLRACLTRVKWIHQNKLRNCGALWLPHCAPFWVLRAAPGTASNRKTLPAASNARTHLLLLPVFELGHAVRGSCQRVGFLTLHDKSSRVGIVRSKLKR